MDPYPCPMSNVNDSLFFWKYRTVIVGVASSFMKFCFKLFRGGRFLDTKILWVHRAIPNAPCLIYLHERWKLVTLTSHSCGKWLGFKHSRPMEHLAMQWNFLPGKPSVPFRQLWLVLGVKIKMMEMNSNLFSRYLFVHRFLKKKRWSAGWWDLFP